MPNEPRDADETARAQVLGYGDVAGSLRRAAERHRDVGRLLDRAADVVLEDGGAVLLAELQERLDELAVIDAGAARAVGRLIEG